jgi:filamentous hemagglutinin
VSPPRISNGVTLNPRLPDPVAGLNYTPNTLDSSNLNIANSQVNGYVAELNTANDVAGISGETVVKYGDEAGTHGADIVSVNQDGSVNLWDAKFRSSRSDVGESTTFSPGSSALNGALNDAAGYIENASNISDELRQAALTNLEEGNYRLITVGQGQVTTSTISVFKNGVWQ